MILKLLMKIILLLSLRIICMKVTLFTESPIKKAFFSTINGLLFVSYLGTLLGMTTQYFVVMPIILLLEVMVILMAKSLNKYVWLNPRKPTTGI